jgi:hypothetical protein
MQQTTDLCEEQTKTSLRRVQKPYRRNDIYNRKYIAAVPAGQTAAGHRAKEVSHENHHTDDQ